MEFMNEFIQAKYHMSVVDRMLDTYREYPDKRILVGIINEAARCSVNVVKSFMIYERVYGDFDKFLKRFAPKYLSQEQIEAISKILEIAIEQKKSPVEFSKDDKIILMVGNKYKILTVERLFFFISLIRSSVQRFGEICRQV